MSNGMATYIKDPTRKSGPNSIYHKNAAIESFPKDTFLAGANKSKEGCLAHDPHMKERVGADLENGDLPRHTDTSDKDENATGCGIMNAHKDVIDHHANKLLPFKTHGGPNIVPLHKGTESLVTPVHSAGGHTTNCDTITTSYNGSVEGCLRLKETPDCRILDNWHMDALVPGIILNNRILHLICPP